MNFPFRSALLATCIALSAFLSFPGLGQVSSSNGANQSSSVTPRRGVEAAGSAVTLDVSEPLFTVAAALNACGYDAGLDRSLPLRAHIRQEIAAQVDSAEGALPAKRALCDYVAAHQLQGSQNLAQYVSLALFLTPPPQLALSYPESEMPPDALNVVNVLPLLRTFSETVHLHAIYLAHHRDYDAALAQVHDTVTRMLLETNVYLHQPVSSYDGRRFVVLLEPMLSPAAVNARVYGTDYFVVASAGLPNADNGAVGREAAGQASDLAPDLAAGLPLEDLRHVYLLYEVDPLVFARASATNRFLPILKAVQGAPIDFYYKNDVLAFTTECLIKAIEARTMDVGFAKPARLYAGKERFDPTGYNIAVAEYDRRAEAVRRKQVIADMRSGWVLTEYFYDKLALTDREGVSIKDNMAELVYSMDVNSETSRAKKVPFFPEGSPEIVGASTRTQRARAPRRVLTPMDQAEVALQRGDRASAENLANKELALHPGSTDALYVLARLNLIEGEPQEAFDRFTAVVATGKDPRTIGWAHVYLGRLYDAMNPPARPKALVEYKAAAATPGIQPDLQAAAESGLKQPFAAPRRAAQPTAAKDDELDPTGKKQKESYTPLEESKPGTTKPK